MPKPAQPQREMEDLNHAVRSDLVVINALLVQLSSRLQPRSLSDLIDVVKDPNAHLLVVRENGDKIVAMLTLIVAPPSLVKRRATIEDFVVDAAARRQGLAGWLLQVAELKAQQAGATEIRLTSRSSRVEANKFYLGKGYKLIASGDTNLYVKSLTD